MGTTQLEFGGLRSSVVVDGSDVPHYGVQYDENAKEVTSWIESEKDKVRPRSKFLCGLSILYSSQALCRSFGGY